jgi:AmiR/NasT family two-component response regulator
MMARFQSILDITGNADGPLKTADEVEELLIQEMRRVGNAAMNQWAVQAEERVRTELKEKNPTLRARKKER